MFTFTPVTVHPSARCTCNTCGSISAAWLVAHGKVAHFMTPDARMAWLAQPVPGTFIYSIQHEHALFYDSLPEALENISAAGHWWVRHTTDADSLGWSLES